MFPPVFSIAAICITITVLLGYFLLLSSQRLHLELRRFSSAENYSLLFCLYERISGLLILGVFTVLLLLIISVGNSGTVFFTGAVCRFYLIPVCSTFIFILSFFATRKARNRKGYPLIRKKNWTASLMIRNQLSWIVYLVAYEYLLRGVLLSSCITLFNMRAAIGVNLILYAMLHLHRDIRQLLFSIPFGIVLCLLTVATHSWISAALLHSAFAISYEFFVIAHRNRWRRNFGKHGTIINTKPAF